MFLFLIRYGGWKECFDGENLFKIKGVCLGEGLWVLGLLNLSVWLRVIRILEEIVIVFIFSF